MLIRSCIFFVFLIVWTSLIFIAWSPTFLTFNRSIISKCGMIWGFVLLKMLAIICRLRYKIEGEANIPNQACIFASKHQSTWETIFFMYYMPNIKCILKKELTKIPFYGWYAKLVGMVAVDRSLGGAALRKMVKDIKHAVEEGESILIFPEGTRVKPLETKKYQPGIAAIHGISKATPIVPVAVNSGYFWPKGFLIKPGVITIKFLPAIIGEFSKHELIEKLQTLIDQESENL